MLRPGSITSSRRGSLEQGTCARYRQADRASFRSDITLHAPRSTLEAAAMKVQTMEEAESGSATRLANADLLGAYAPEVGRGTTVTILERDGRLIRRILDSPQAQ